MGHELQSVMEIGELRFVRGDRRRRDVFGRRVGVS